MIGENELAMTDINVDSQNVKTNSLGQSVSTGNSRASKARQQAAEATEVK